MIAALKPGTLTSLLLSGKQLLPRLVGSSVAAQNRTAPTSLEVGKSYRAINGETITILANVGGDLPWKGMSQHDAAVGYWTDQGRRNTYERSVHDLIIPGAEAPETGYEAEQDPEPKDRLLAIMKKLEALPNASDPALSAMKELALALYHDRSAQNGEISRLKEQVADLKHQLYWLKKDL